MFHRACAGEPGHRLHAKDRGGLHPDCGKGEAHGGQHTGRENQGSGAAVSPVAPSERSPVLIRFGRHHRRARIHPDEQPRGEQYAKAPRAPLGRVRTLGESRRYGPLYRSRAHQDRPAPQAARGGARKFRQGEGGAMVDSRGRSLRHHEDVHGRRRERHRAQRRRRRAL